jgi:hypothetical protein
MANNNDIAKAYFTVNCSPNGISAGWPGRLIFLSPQTKHEESQQPAQLASTATAMDF